MSITLMPRKRPAHRYELDTEIIDLLAKKKAAEGRIGSMTNYVAQILKNYALSPTVPIAYGRVLLDEDASEAQPPNKRKPRGRPGS